MYITTAAWKVRWPDFAPAEVLSPHGLESYFNRQNLLIDDRSLDFLQSFRNFVDKPLVVNFNAHRLRGYRSPEENRLVRGATRSYHMRGQAFDVTCMDVSLSLYDLKELAIDFGWTGIGYYVRHNFLHLDTRPNKATWQG